VADPVPQASPREGERLPATRPRRTGVLVGGSGLVGGTLLHHFKHAGRGRVELLAPNSKELSLRVAGDVRSYFERVRPDFIVNCAIATLESDPQLTFEVNCLGAVYLARAAQELGIPYIHVSSGALMPSGIDLPEEARLPLVPDMPNYARGKLLAELALERMREAGGLDFTSIRLGIVYGAHDHKIQGFHRLLFALVDGSMPALFTTREARHSYTNARKLPHLIEHMLDHRDEFGGRTWHFVDPEPVRLGELILTARRLLGVPKPREVYVPYGVARVGVALLARLARWVSRLGVDARAPAETVFLRNFYESQVLSGEKLRRSSFVDPEPEATVFSELPQLIEYYVPRWEHLNLVEPRARTGQGGGETAQQFYHSPEKLLSAVLAGQERPFLRQCPLGEPPGAEEDVPSEARGGS